MIKNNKSRHFLSYLVLLLVMISGVALAKAPTPAAGTTIKNQASATYRDSAGITQTATSNLVETVIQQVGAFLLEQDDQSRYGVSGQEIYYPHVLTNTGNGDDSFALSTSNRDATSDDFDFSSIAIYADENQDGVADNLDPITNTGTLAAGEAFYFVVMGMIPDGQTEGKTGNLTVTGTSAFMTNASTAGSSKSNEDEAVVTDKAVIQVTKSMSAESGVAGSTHTVTLTYSNPSAATASDVKLVDILPTGMTYVSDSGEWSVTGGTVLTDASEAPQGTAETIIYCAYNNACSAGANQVTAVIASVVPGGSGTVSFQVELVGDVASTLLNVAQFSYKNGTDSNADLIPEKDTNQVSLQALTQPAVVANGSTTDSTDLVGEKVTVASAGLGSTVTFNNVIWNLGNSTDTFDISMDEAGSTFPDGTLFTLYKSDGFTPLLDTDNSGVVDTGPLESALLDTGSVDPDKHYVVVLKAILPVTATPGTNSGNGFEITKTATSALDTSVKNSVTDHLISIDPLSAAAVDGNGVSINPGVDLTNVAPIGGSGVKGVGTGPESDAQSQLILAPGESGSFKLYVNNTSTIADSFDLTFSAVGDPFAPGTAPDGWRVAFHEDAGATNCSVLGPVVNNTALIAVGASKLICAKITLPDNAAFDGNAVSIYFRAMSPLTGVSDVKHDAVYMTAAQQLILEPDNRAQVEPGNSVVYAHRIHNPGNTVFTSIKLSSEDTEDSWTTVLYRDSDKDGVLTSADEAIGSADLLDVTSGETLDPGETITIFAKVFAPANTPYGTTNLTDITAIGMTYAGSDPGATDASIPITVNAQDMTFVAKSNMKIIKEQAPDVDCDGEVDSGESYSFDSFAAKPRSCVLYRLTATNTSAGVANNVRINDAIPNFTSHFTDGGALPVITKGTVNGTIDQKPDEGGTGIIEGNAGVVNPGESASLVFGVKVD